jgi:hypothetical protein
MANDNEVRGSDVTVTAQAAVVSVQASNPSLRLWHWYSYDQAIAASFFARRSRELEESKEQPVSDGTIREHRSSVLASVLSSGTFLEACVNELFASARHDDLKVGGELPADDRRKLTSTAELLEGNRLLDRFQLALYVLGKTPLDQGAQPYQGAELLVSLRNTLVHYKPRWSDETETKLAKRLESKRFSLNPFTGDGNPFFPDKCLSYGCAKWGWESALSFADRFFALVGVVAPYDGIRSDLQV